MTATDLRSQLKERGLLPHQADFVEAALARLPRGRILLADAVGLGKSRACASLVWALAKRFNRTPRTLVLASKALLPQWKALLADFGIANAVIVDAGEYRRLEARTQPDENPWGAVTVALSTLDFVKRDARLSLFVAAAWDLVILEEAHQATADSDRGRVMKALWGSASVGLMVATSATPYTGRVDDFEPFVGTKILRRRAGDLRDWEGNPILRGADQRILDIVRIDLSSAERALFEFVRQLAATAMERLNSAGTSSPHGRFLLDLFTRRAASSLFALEQTARRALVTVGPFGAVSPLGAERLDSQTEVVDSGVGLAETLQTISSGELRGLLDLTDRVEVDSKWKACSIILREGVEKRTPTVVFCDFADTAEYLVGMLSSCDCASGAVTGSTEPQERQRIVDSVWERGGVLVLTTAACEGLRMSFAKRCVHYDIPWTPGQLAQRLGRVHRFGAPPGFVRHIVFVDEILTSQTRIREMFAHDDSGSDIPDIYDILPGNI